MKLAILGDLHYHEADESTEAWVTARDAFYKKMLHHFMSAEADMHISLGDLTNFGTEREINEVYDIIEQYDGSFFHVLGNHDTYSQTKRDLLTLTGQARYQALTMDKAILVFLDTTREMDLTNWGGWMDEEQLSWFENVIVSSGTKPMLVFAHHPVHLTTTGSDRDKGSIDPSIDMWRILSKKQGTAVYFNGHTHVDSITKQNNWTFVQLSACLDEHAFRMVELGDDYIDITAVDIEDAELPKQLPEIHLHMKHFSPSVHARGTELERGCRVMLTSQQASFVSADTAAPGQGHV
ncbi:metallophosphoesterase family protein [Paenibacillus shunpengii]|uniref:Metallophosphoesterase family protein n=1 Tax=Paenibacillus shunpengii TaxID=2054424 RepID=A0ABW5SIE9_9BACL|nr:MULTISPECIES: metallophosphoesterase [unclassified Paenibacillus]OMC72119.1 metallophosphoesterase [Paenibacillus sp. FSL H7-0326]SDX35794.1 Calcineurin-like phosphoesterase [Paenibacillus sp. PDC88]